MRILISVYVITMGHCVRYNIIYRFCAFDKMSEAFFADIHLLKNDAKKPLH